MAGTNNPLGKKGYFPQFTGYMITVVDENDQLELITVTPDMVGTGLKWKVRNVHHRLSICLELGIDIVSIKFTDRRRNK